MPASWPCKDVVLHESTVRFDRRLFAQWLPGYTLHCPSSPLSPSQLGWPMSRPRSYTVLTRDATVSLSLFKEHLELLFCKPSLSVRDLWIATQDLITDSVNFNWPNWTAWTLVYVAWRRTKCKRKRQCLRRRFARARRKRFPIFLQDELKFVAEVFDKCFWPETLKHKPYHPPPTTWDMQQQFLQEQSHAGCRATESTKRLHQSLRKVSWFEKGQVSVCQ